MVAPLLAIATTAVIVVMAISRGFFHAQTEGSKGIDYQQIMMITISLSVLAVGLWVICDKNQNDSTRKWAFGVIGTLIGYWSKRDKVR